MQNEIGDIFSHFNCVPKPSQGHSAELKRQLTRSVKGTLGMMSIESVAFFIIIKTLRDHSNHCRAIGMGVTLEVTLGCRPDSVPRAALIPVIGWNAIL